MCLIADPNTLADLRRDWTAVERLCDNASTSHMVGTVFFNGQASDGFFNLPLVLAYGVLDDALKALIKQGVFVDNEPGPKGLFTRLRAAKIPLQPWINWDKVDEGRDARNGVAHKAILRSEADCRAYIGTVRLQLLAWRIV